MLKGVIASAFFAFLLTTMANPAQAACPTFADIAGDWVTSASGGLTDFVNPQLDIAAVCYVQILATGRYKSTCGSVVAGSPNVQKGSGRLRILPNCLVKLYRSDATSGTTETTYHAVINRNKMVVVSGFESPDVNGTASEVWERADFSPY